MLEIKDHELFAGINWGTLYQGKGMLYREELNKICFSEFNSHEVLESSNNEEIQDFLEARKEADDDSQDADSADAALASLDFASFSYVNLVGLSARTPRTSNRKIGKDSTINE